MVKSPAIPTFKGDAAQHAFFWTRNGGMVDLGTLGGTYSFAQALNSAGHVVGHSHLQGNSAHRAFLWRGSGAMIDLGTLGGSTSQALGVNASGQVVGCAQTAAGVNAPFLYTPASGGGTGSMTNLGGFGGTNGGCALRINSSGQVIGYSFVPNNSYYHAFLYTPGANGAAGTLTELYLPGGQTGYSYPYALNENGQVVGYSRVNGADRGFLYTPGSGGSPGTIVDLGTLGGSHTYPQAINSSGQVAGYSMISANQWRPFLYTPARNGYRHADLHRRRRAVRVRRQAFTRITHDCLSRH